MSGIVGIVQLDGAPVERALLQRMTDFMAFRGPHAQAIWNDGAVGLGHTLLRATFEHAREQQPCSLDGQVWITADARIDGRSELQRELTAAGRPNTADATDAELILHAYHAWGEACVLHLLGDFSFAIWDGPQRKLFCARDHFGVKPFYYAQTKDALIISNTLKCVRLHPAVTAELNEIAIGDYLLFNYNQEFDTTVFADIRQLAPAHTLTLCDGAVRLQRYWTLPIETELRYKQPNEYVEHFRALFDQAVSDRVQTNHISILLSGGLDSTSIASVARRVRADAAFDLRAYTFSFGEANQDPEPGHASLVAQELHIPIQFLAAAQYQAFERWDDPTLFTPEPINRPLHAMRLDALRMAALHASVLLSGDGGDPVLYPSSGYFINLAKQLRFGRMLSDMLDYRRTYGHRPPLYFGKYLRKKLHLDDPYNKYAPCPPWLDSAFVKRCRLDERWERAQNPAPSLHPLRPEAYDSLSISLWPHRFTNLDPGVTQIPLETRYAYFDVRLISYLLRVPPMPWFVKKQIVRSAMNTVLPEAIRTRAKASYDIGRDDLPTSQEIRMWAGDIEKVPMTAKWVDVSAYRQLSDQLSTVEPSAADTFFRPPSLARWLQSIAR
jgi:asparagine synthase (glutamine-hydrolysing)